MDRKELLEELKKLKSSDNQILLSDRALNDLITLSDDNFKYFFEFAKKDLTTRNKKVQTNILVQQKDICNLFLIFHVQWRTARHK